MQFPIARIKRIIKEDSDINSCSTDAAVLCTIFSTTLNNASGSIASELFLKTLADKAYINVIQDKRKVLQYKDLGTFSQLNQLTSLAKVCSQDRQFEFLEELIPFPLPLVSALEIAKKDAEDRKKNIVDDLKLSAAGVEV